MWEFIDISFVKFQVEQKSIQLCFYGLKLSGFQKFTAKTVICHTEMSRVHGHTFQKIILQCSVLKVLMRVGTQVPGTFICGSQVYTSTFFQYFECHSALNLESDLAGTKHANRVTGKQRDLGLLGIWPGTHLGPRKECLAAYNYPLSIFVFRVLRRQNLNLEFLDLPVRQDSRDRAAAADV